MKIISSLVMILIVLCVCIGYAGIYSGEADLVLGQPDYISLSANFTLEKGMKKPTGIAVDQVSGRVFVVDRENSRVLWWNDFSSLNNGEIADGVLGQADLSSDDANRGGLVEANTLRYPTDVAVDSVGNVWVSDSLNHRVVKYSTPIVSGMDAALVLGQQSFTVRARNDSDGDGTTDTVTATTYNYPCGILIDSYDNIWVADNENSRVLKYSTPTVNGVAADFVLGQADFTSSSINRGGSALADTGSVAANTLYWPWGLSLDSSGNLWVTDQNNHRILKYITPSSNGADADLVLGQADFISNSLNRGGSVAANTLYYPAGVSVNSSGDVWVVDYYNHRILKYITPSSNGADADLVLGQADFISNSLNRGGSVNSNTLRYPFGVLADNFGDVWIADSGNNRVVKYVLEVITINSVSPLSEIQGKTTDITITGENFVSTPTVTFSGSGITVNSVTVISTTTLTVNITISSSATIGQRDVTVKNTDARTGIKVQAFEIKSVNPEPENVHESEIDKDMEETVTLEADTGDMSVEVPAGTFSENVRMRLRTVEVPASIQNTLKKTDIGLDISVSSGKQPLKRLKIIIKYRDADIAGLDEGKLTLCRYDEDNLRWIVLASETDCVNNCIEAWTDHLSIFALMQLTADSALDSVKVFPNPYNPAEGNFTFDNLTASANITIYTVLGTLVRELDESDGDGRCEWDGKNEAGKTVASGIYIVRISSFVDEKLLKIAVVR